MGPFCGAVEANERWGRYVEPFCGAFVTNDQWGRHVGLEGDLHICHVLLCNLHIFHSVCHWHVVVMWEI